MRVIGRKQSLLGRLSCKRLKNRKVILVGLVVLFCTLVSFYEHLSAVYPKSTDQAAYFLAGVAIAEGNWQLRGWTLTPPDFWTSDIALSAILSDLPAALGFSRLEPVLLFVQPAITWTLLVMLAAYVTIVRRRTANERLFALVMIIASLGVPLMRPYIKQYIMMSAIHLGSAIYCIAALHFADRALTGDRRSFFFLPVLLALGLVGDPLVLVAGVLPVLVAVLVLPGLERKMRWRMAVATILSVVGGEGALALNRATGGFTTSDLPFQFGDFNALGDVLAVTLRAVLELFSCDVFGRSLSSSLAEILHLPLFFASIVALRIAISAVRRAEKPTPDSQSSLAFMLAAGSLCDLAAVLFSDRVRADGVGLSAARYLFPFWIDASILSALVLRDRALLGCIAVFVIVTTSAADLPDFMMRGGRLITPAQQSILAYVKARGLHVGIGSWWESRILTLASHGQINVVPAIRGPSGGLYPLIQISNSFKLPDPRSEDMFVIIPPTGHTFEEGDVKAKFGTPKQRDLVAGNYVLFIYRARPLPK